MKSEQMVGIMSRIVVYLYILILAVLLLPLRLCAQLSPAEVTGDAALLHDPDPAVRVDAAKRMGSNHELRSAEMLRTLLYDADAKVRVAATEVLGNWAYKGAIPDLLALCNDPDADVRAAAVRAVVVFHDPAQIEVLLPLLRDISPNVRAFDATTLGALNNARAIAPLRELLDDTSAQVRAAAARALGEVSQLPSWVPGVPSNWQAFLDTPQKSDDATRKVMQAIFKQVGWEQTREALAKLLLDADPAVRAAAVLSLAELRDQRASTLLADAVRLALPQQRAELYTALAAAHPSELVDIAMQQLTLENDNNAFAALISLLGAAQEPRALDSMMATVPKKGGDIRAALLQALGQYGDPRVLATILAYKKDPYYAIRTAVATSLGNLHDPRTVDDIVAMTKDGYYYVRRAAMLSLRQYNDPRLVKPLLTLLDDPDYLGYRWLILSELQKYTDAAIPIALLKYKDDENSRTLIYRIMSAYDDPRITPALIAAMQDPDVSLRRLVAGQLIAHKNPAFANAYIAALQDTDLTVRRYAVTALKQLKDPRAIDPLITALRTLAPDERPAVAQALQTLTGQALGVDPDHWLTWRKGKP